MFNGKFLINLIATFKVIGNRWSSIKTNRVERVKRKFFRRKLKLSRNFHVMRSVDHSNRSTVFWFESDNIWLDNSRQVIVRKGSLLFLWIISGRLIRFVNYVKCRQEESRRWEKEKVSRLIQLRWYDKVLLAQQHNPWQCLIVLFSFCCLFLLSALSSFSSHTFKCGSAAKLRKIKW